MNLDAINYLNIGFMILSGIIAFVLPFELTLLSYIVLGPLHYLTEIPWLQKRQFFMPRKNDYLWLFLLSLVIVFPTMFKVGYKFFIDPSSTGAYYPAHIKLFLARANLLRIIAIPVVLISSVVFVLTENITKRAIAVGIVVLWCIIYRAGSLTITMSFLSLTLLHVYCFTGVFILSGALKSRSLSGTLSLVVFLACSALLLFLPFHSGISPTAYAVKGYNLSFYGLNKRMFKLFMHKNASFNDVYFSPAGIAIARLVAYAYLYHYLNWFSKTSIIGWHRISKKSLVSIVVIWIASIAVYLYDFTMGFAVQFFLSALNVIFEYPLNFQSFRDVGNNLALMVWNRKHTEQKQKTAIKT
jgi:hypothetical protein